MLKYIHISLLFAGFISKMRHSVCAFFYLKCAIFSICFAPLQIVKRAYDLFYILLRHFRVNHRRFYAFVPEQLLNVADVRAVFQNFVNSSRGFL
jgi:hypothetical protein